MSAETWTGIIGFLVGVAGAVINIYIGTTHKDDSMKNLLLLTGGLGILSIIIMIVFPPIGILLLITTLVLNTVSSLNESNKDYSSWLDAAALLTMGGVIMASLSAYYRALKVLTPKISIPTGAIFIIILGALLVFGGAIVNFYAGRVASCASGSAECKPNLELRNYHYILGAVLLGSLALMPVLFMINRVFAIIGLLLIIATVVANIVLAEQSLDDKVLHGWSNTAAWLSGFGLLMFTVAIWYIGTFKARPTYEKTLPLLQKITETDPVYSRSVFDSLPKDLQQVIKAEASKLAAAEASKLAAASASVPVASVPVASVPVASVPAASSVGAGAGAGVARAPRASGPDIPLSELEFVKM